MMLPRKKSWIFAIVLTGVLLGMTDFALSQTLPPPPPPDGSMPPPPDCPIFPPPEMPTPDMPMQCSDRCDNDRNGKTDCADHSCLPFCPLPDGSLPPPPDGSMPPPPGAMLPPKPPPSPIYPATLVTDYGAVCDGVTDDSESIQKALNDFASWENRTLLFPPGQTCLAVGLEIGFESGRLTGGIVTPPMEGTEQNPYRILGNGATLKAPDGAPITHWYRILLIKDSSWVQIERLNFDGNRDNREIGETPAHNFTILSGHDITVMDVATINAVVDGYAVTPSDQTDTTTFPYNIRAYDLTAKNAWRTNVSFFGCWNCGISGGQFIGATDNRPDNFMPETGIDLEPDTGAATPAMKNFVLENIYIAHNKGRCIQLSNYAGDSEGTVIRNNILENCGEDLSDCCGTAIYDGHKNTVFADNLIRNFEIPPTANTRVSLIHFGQDPVTGGAKVTGNTIENIVLNGKWVFYVNDGNNGGNIVKNNVLKNIGVAADGSWCHDELERFSKGEQSNFAVFENNTVDGVPQAPNPGCPHGSAY